MRDALRSRERSGATSPAVAEGGAEAVSFRSAPTNVAPGNFPLSRSPRPPPSPPPSAQTSSSPRRRPAPTPSATPPWTPNLDALIATAPGSRAIVGIRPPRHRAECSPAAALQCTPVPKPRSVARPVARHSAPCRYHTVFRQVTTMIQPRLGAEQTVGAFSSGGAEDAATRS